MLGSVHKTIKGVFTKHDRKCSQNMLGSVHMTGIATPDEEVPYKRI